MDPAAHLQADVSSNQVAPDPPVTTRVSLGRAGVISLLSASTVTLLAVAVARISTVTGAAVLELFPGGTSAAAAALIFLVSFASLVLGLGLEIERRCGAGAFDSFVIGITSAPQAALAWLVVLNAATFRSFVSRFAGLIDSIILGVLVSLVFGLTVAAAWQRFKLGVSRGEALVRRFSEAGLSLAVSSGIFLLVALIVDPGVNKNFAVFAAPLLGAFAAAFLLAARLWPEPARPRKTLPAQPASKVMLLALLLLPLVPLARYMALNAPELSAVEWLHFFLAASGLSFAAILVIPFATVVISRGGFRLIPVAVVPSATMFVIFNMATLSNQRQWYDKGENLLALAIVIGVSFILAGVARLSADFALTAVAALVVLEALAPFVAGQRVNESANLLAPAEQSDLWVDQLRGAADSFAYQPSIYLLMYESYANLETMDFYGIDNADQVNFLEGLGFQVLHGTYSNGASTLRTTSTLLAAQSELSEDGRYYTSGRGAVPQALSAAGYETISVNSHDWLFRGWSSAYDRTVPSVLPRGTVGALKNVLSGEFRFEDSYFSIDYNEYLEAKRAALSETSAAPQFMQTINRYPGHTQNSGQCIPGELEAYAIGVERANEEMMLDLDALQTKLGTAIIIIAGDHGPYLTQNCSGIPPEWDQPISRFDVQDRYGTFLAIHWPEEIKNSYEIEVLQEVFVAIFATLAQDGALWDTRPIHRDTLGGVAGPVSVKNGFIIGGVDDGRPLFNGADSSIDSQNPTNKAAAGR